MKKRQLTDRILDGLKFRSNHDRLEARRRILSLIKSYRLKIEEMYVNDVLPTAADIETLEIIMKRLRVRCADAENRARFE